MGSPASERNRLAAYISSIADKPYRLLTEAERECVARAGTTTPFWWGSSISNGAGQLPV
jgi:formylglycine-generating enzyme required for sulfatase activity